MSQEVDFFFLGGGGLSNLNSLTFKKLWLAENVTFLNMYQCIVNWLKNLNFIQQSKENEPVGVLGFY